MQYHLGMVYSKMGDRHNAALHLNKAISLAPNSPAARDARTELQKLG
jgi:Flp pilus assembly protein TadD